MKKEKKEKPILFEGLMVDITDKEIEVNYPILNSDNLEKTIDLNQELEYLSIIIGEDNNE